MSRDVFRRWRKTIQRYHLNKIDTIRGNNRTAFTRHRKVSPESLLLQMLSQRGMAQRQEVKILLEDSGMSDIDISDVGFYKARMKYSPGAVKEMFEDFTDDETRIRKSEMRKFKSFHVFAIDGSELVLPSDTEFETIADIQPTSKAAPDDMPHMIKLSGLSDVYNHTIKRIAIDEYSHDERGHAIELLGSIKKEEESKTLVVFDRGYFSFKLLNLFDNSKMKYIFRISTYVLSKCRREMESDNEVDKTFKVRLTRANTNGFRNETELVQEVLSKTFVIRMAIIDIGKEEKEFLITNLSDDEASVEELKELYHARWDIETAFRDMKKCLKLEEFSGRRERLILQDIYACAWVFNMVQFIIMERKCSLIQGKKHQMKHNRSVAIGAVKRNLVKALMHPSSRIRKESFANIIKEIDRYLTPIRPNRSFSREHKAKNHSRMSYRSNY